MKRITASFRKKSLSPKPVLSRYSNFHNSKFRRQIKKKKTIFTKDNVLSGY